MTPEEIEKAQLALERKQLDSIKLQPIGIETFSTENSGVLISAAVSFAAVIVSIGQVWVADPVC